MLCEEHSILKKETTDVDGRKMNTCREIGLLIQEVSLENVATTFSLQQQLLYPRRVNLRDKNCTRKSGLS